MIKLILAITISILSSACSDEKPTSAANSTDFEVIKQLGELSSPPSQFATVKEVIEDFNDYKSKEGAFKIIKNQPLHIQLSPTILGSHEYPDGSDDPAKIEEESKHTLVYGIYTAFIHTPVNQITVTSIPMVFNLDTRKHKYLPAYKKTLTISRDQALEKIQKFIPVTSFAQLKTDETVPGIEGLINHDQWTKQFGEIYYNHTENPGLDNFFNELVNGNNDNQ
jgi:hypothetical protein